MFSLGHKKRMSQRPKLTIDEKLQDSKYIYRIQHIVCLNQQHLVTKA